MTAPVSLNGSSALARDGQGSSIPSDEHAAEQEDAPSEYPAPGARSRKPHLLALLTIAALFAGALVVLEIYVNRVETAYVHTLPASDEEYHSLRSLAIERRAVQQPDLLPLYGSSELVKPVPGRAPVFFRTYPAGYSIFPIGKAGAYPLILLQHIASAGPDLRGRKVAISLSAGWFRESDMVPDQYRGCFLLPTAREFLFSTHLSYGLRQDAARRFLRFPETLDRDPVADFAARRLAAGGGLDRFAYWVAWPLGRLQILVSRWQDHFEIVVAAWRLRKHPVAIRHVPTELDWPKLVAAAAARSAGDRAGDEVEPSAAAGAPSGRADAEFLSSLRNSPAWEDLELLLRTLHEVGARPLLLCTPLKGRSFAKAGVSQSARAAFYRRFAEAAARYDIPLRQFTDHDTDRDFVHDRNDHLSEVGWMYYNQAIDDFMQDRDRSAAAEAPVADRESVPPSSPMK